MHAPEYRVRLDAFEGPLDLLLYLIRRAEVEITDIPMAQLTDQYMEYMRSEGLAQIDIETAGEFLVMAATLMEIKSRMLLPPDENAAQNPAEGLHALDAGASKAEDPRAELVRQLLAYKKFRDAAEGLQHRLEEWESRYPAQRIGVDRKRVGEVLADMADVDLEDLDIVDLVEAFARVIETVDMSRVGEHRVVVDDTPIELHAEDIIDRLKREAASPTGNATGEIEFTRIFSGRPKGEVIGLFLAMLELVKQRRVRVRQEGAGTIMVGLSDDAEQGPMPEGAEAGKNAEQIN